MLAKSRWFSKYRAIRSVVAVPCTKMRSTRRRQLRDGYLSGNMACSATTTFPLRVAPTPDVTEITNVEECSHWVAERSERAESGLRNGRNWRSQEFHSTVAYAHFSAAETCSGVVWKDFVWAGRTTLTAGRGAYRPTALERWIDA